MDNELNRETSDLHVDDFTLFTDAIEKGEVIEEAGNEIDV